MEEMHLLRIRQGVQRNLEHKFAKQQYLARHLDWANIAALQICVPNSSVLLALYAANAFLPYSLVKNLKESAALSKLSLNVKYSPPPLPLFSPNIASAPKLNTPLLTSSNANASLQTNSHI